MGYSDVVVRVYIDVLGPLYVLPGPAVDAPTFIEYGMSRLRVCPGIYPGPH